MYDPIGHHTGHDLTARGLHERERTFFRFLRALPRCPRSRVREDPWPLVLQPRLRAGRWFWGEAQARRSRELALSGPATLLPKAAPYGASIGG